MDFLCKYEVSDYQPANSKHFENMTKSHEK